MINQDKPNVGVPQTNQAKASIGATWDTITTSWATETQSWEEASQLISNSARTSSSITNQAKP